MTLRIICVALALSSLPIAGCGTAANLVRPGPVEGGKCPFGGVKQDLCCLRGAASGDLCFKTNPGPGSEQYPQVAVMLFCAADLPFSFLGDILTWPYVVSYSFINEPIPIPPLTQVQPIPVPQLMQGQQVTDTPEKKDPPKPDPLDKTDGSKTDGSKTDPQEKKDGPKPDPFEKKDGPKMDPLEKKDLPTSRPPVIPPTSPPMLPFNG